VSLFICRSVECHYAECRYAERRYAECRGAGPKPLILRLLCDNFTTEQPGHNPYCVAVFYYVLHLNGESSLMSFFA
jgi:hypothetical protein